ncbi:carboxymuconolactone decarboxylase family protein [Methanolobus vulcani]|jgi:alkylhydroperoxidase/carboxymuconolactone decarboxylase family protein YurZ|uniref:Carboxymuconolactone decarboxylase family protein n=1 Tax=Methanolobus vulcani TaxID=38026 RepID=A0A7Z8P3G4_9EURY|nr:carboxymuconolactone decarboxylase family protein [Methanolobus vulcani]TQD28287.1 carboxymuconolactone decarboxylase family protein [Methanolobus vulcani]
MPDEIKEAKDVKGFQPRAVTYAEKMDDNFAEAVAGFYNSVWDEREDGLSKKQKHLLVFAIACSNQKTKSAVKILQRLKKYGVTAQEIKDVMMIAAWTGGIQNFTNLSPEILKEMERLEF